MYFQGHLVYEYIIVAKVYANHLHLLLLLIYYFLKSCVKNYLFILETVIDNNPTAKILQNI